MKTQSRIPGTVDVNDSINAQREQERELRQLKFDDMARHLQTERKARLAAEQERDSALAVLQEISGITERDYTPSVIEPVTGSNQGEAIALLMCSDWHPYEIVKRNQVNGLNQFTPDICKESVAHLARSFVTLTNIERNGQNIRQGVVAFLGDIIGNMIHRDQIEGNAGTPSEETLFVIFDLAIPMLEYILEHGNFDHLYVKCSHGNHDRDTEKPVYNNAAMHSHAWVVYHVLKRWFQNSKWEKKISFDIAEGYHLYYQVFKWIIRQHHGDAFGYNGGIGGPTIPVKRGIAQWEAGKSVFDIGGERPGHADFDIFGHLHMTFGDNTFASCSSLIGYSPYSVKNKLPFEPPSQRFMLIDKKRWITSDRRIYVR